MGMTKGADRQVGTKPCRGAATIKRVAERITGPRTPDPTSYILRLPPPLKVSAQARTRRPDVELPDRSERCPMMRRKS